MVVSLAGIAGACYQNKFLMWLYLFAMFFVIAALIGFIIFAYAVTDKGSGRFVMNRRYLDYYLHDYSGWLKDRVTDNGYWNDIGSCVRDSGVCKKIRRDLNGVPETPQMFYFRKLTPVEVGNGYFQTLLRGNGYFHEFGGCGYWIFTYMICICFESVVRMLQAANRLWLYVRERDSLDSRRRNGGTEPGLYVVEQ